MIEYSRFLNISIVDSPLEMFVDTIAYELNHGSGPINIMSLNITSLRRYDDEFDHMTNFFNYITADGMGLVKLSRLFGDKIVNHLPIPHVSQRLIEYAHNNKKRVYLLGGTRAINQISILNTANIYPGIVIGGHHGYYNEDDMRGIISNIVDFKPDIILVGISSPKKEKSIIKISREYKDSINVACGGFIDILAGKTKIEPKIIRLLALSWIYRFIQEPRRLFGPMIVNGFYFLLISIPKALYYQKIKREQISLNYLMSNKNRV